MSQRIDLHIHSCYSWFDGLMSPRAVVKVASAVGYDAVAVTDHYTSRRVLRGTVATRKLAAEHGLTAYLGTEYSVTEGPTRGHVLLYFDDVEQVPARGLTLDELVDHVRTEGLTLVHPHPFGFAGIQSLELMRQAHHVELNGSYGTGPVNQQLQAVAAEHALAGKLVANSDAHARGQMGAAYTLVDELHGTVADTLATTRDAVLAEPKRWWGRTAKVARAVAQPVGYVMNGVQRLSTRRAVKRLDAAAADEAMTAAQPA